jgi:WD repeat-containing protein 61
MSLISAVKSHNCQHWGIFANMETAVRVNKRAALTGHTGSVYALETFDDARVFSAGSDHVIATWDLHSPGDGEMMAKTSDVVYSLLMMPEFSLLLAGQSAGGIHVINTETRSEERLLQFHQAAIFKMLVSRKHHLLFSLTGDGDLGITELPEFKLARKMSISGGKLRAITLTPEEDLMAVGAGDGSIYVFSLPGLEPVKHFQAHQEGFSVNALSFSPDGSELMSGSRDAHLNRFDVTNDFELVQSIPAHNYAIYGISYSPDRKVVATCSRDKNIKIWNPQNWEVMMRIDHDQFGGHVNSVNTLLWHEATGNLITAGDDRSVMVWEIMT